MLSRTTAKWRTKLLHVEESLDHAAEVQNQVAALKAEMANPNEETPINLSLKASGSADTHPKDASQRSPKLGSNGSGKGQVPAVTSVSTEGMTHIYFRLLPRLAPFSSKPEDGKDFIHSFIVLPCSGWIRTAFTKLLFCVGQCARLGLRAPSSLPESPHKKPSRWFTPVRCSPRTFYR